MKKKETKKDKLRKWGLPEKFEWHQLRYKFPYQKGIYWYWFSVQVRKSDFKLLKGKCISSGRKLDRWEDGHAGHFINAQYCGPDLLFSPMNVHLESPGSNKWDTQKLGYKKKLNEIYPKLSDTLETMYWCYKEKKPYPSGKMPRFKDWTASEYEDKIKELPSYQQAVLNNKSKEL